MKKKKSFIEQNDEAVKMLERILFGDKKHLSAKEKLAEMDKVTPLQVPDCRPKEEETK